MPGVDSWNLYFEQVVNIDGWERTSLYPHGHFVRTLGDIGDKSTENEVLLLEHDVPFHRYGNEGGGSKGKR